MHKDIEKRREYHRQYRKLNLERVRSYQKQWRAAHPEKIIEGYLKYKQYHGPFYKRERHLKNKYGLTPEEFNQMSEKQGHKCAICLRKEKLCVDHDHVTKKVRGLLCFPCNSALGLLQDSPERLRAAADYLEKVKL